MVKKLYVGQSKQHSVPVVVSDEGIVYIGSFEEPIENVQELLESKINFEWTVDVNKTKPVIEQLDDYLSGKRKVFTCHQDFQWGTNFQQAVWQQLLKIPYGTATSYSEVAQAIGRPSAVRAVANAIGRNPLSIMIPCHRVLTKDGHLGGYSGGLSMKQTLLAIENMTYK